VRHLSKTIGLLTLFCGLLLSGCAGGTAPTPELNFTPQAAEPSAGGDAGQPDTAALVNGQPISSVAYERELARFEAGKAALGYEIADQAGYRQQVLDLLIEQELIRQLAAAQGIVVSDEAVDAEIEKMIQETSEEYFIGWLASNYYTLDEFRAAVRLELITQQLLAPVVDSVPTTAEHVHARHILVNSQAEAEDVLARHQNGEDFTALAAEYSVDVSSRDNGGDLDWFPRGGLLVPEVEETAFSMAPGQTSGVIVSAWGYHIVQTLEFDPAREIDYNTRQRLIKKAIENWRLGLRNGADIQQFITLASS
jgi:parvulin-like peptidyl-prolyl isomerase